MEISSSALRYIFSNMADAVCVTGMKGNVLFLNDAAQKIFGFPDGGIGKKIWELIPVVPANDELLQLLIDSVSDKRRSLRALADYENKDGEKSSLHVSMTCIMDGGLGFLLVISDLTELMKVNSAFVRYTSPDIAEYVLTTKEGSEQGGRLRDVTVLMSDLRGFTAISTSLEAEHLVDMLNHYFEIMAGIIDRNGGTIIEFLGDGIFAVFGAPKDNDDHAGDAVRCAIEMENAMPEINKWNLEKGYPQLEMGIGINSGSATVGNIGSDKKMKFGCVGPNVNLAGRIEAMTGGGQILISEYTRSLIKDELEVAGENSILPKGGNVPIAIFDVTGIGDVRKEDSDDEIVWVPLKSPAGLTFRLIEAKIVGEEVCAGRLTALSEDEKYAVLETKKELPVFQNIMIEEGGSVYAKVVAHTDGGCRLRFTYRPEGYRAWIDAYR